MSLFSFLRYIQLRFFIPMALLPFIIVHLFSVQFKGVKLCHILFSVMFSGHGIIKETFIGLTMQYVKTK